MFLLKSIRMLKLFSVKNLFDIHCHIVPYVDDGAEDIEEAKRIIEEEYNQGARVIVMTVHLRNKAFDSPIEKVRKHFDELKRWLRKTDMDDIHLFLSREYYCDERFERLLDGYRRHEASIDFEGIKYVPKDEIIPFGARQCILLEFSSRESQESLIEDMVLKTLEAGLTPVLAHVERYPIVHERPSFLCKLREYGAYAQVNCESLLSSSRDTICETAKILAKNNLIDIVSSDAHGMDERSPNIKRCYKYLNKKYGKPTADLLMRDNAKFLIYGE